MKKFISFVLTISIMLTSFFVPVKAVTVPKLPKAAIVSYQKLYDSYPLNESISIYVNCPDYVSSVQYRVIVYNATTKKTVNLYPTPSTGYYSGTLTSGRTTFAINYTFREKGIYTFTVLVKRNNVKVPYDNYFKTDTIYVGVPNPKVKPIVTNNISAQDTQVGNMIYRAVYDRQAIVNNAIKNPQPVFQVDSLPLGVAIKVPIGKYLASGKDIDIAVYGTDVDSKLMSYIAKDARPEKIQSLDNLSKYEIVAIFGKDVTGLEKIAKDNKNIIFTVLGDMSEDSTYISQVNSLSKLDNVVVTGRVYFPYLTTYKREGDKVVGYTNSRINQIDIDVFSPTIFDSYYSSEDKHSLLTMASSLALLLEKNKTITDMDDYVKNHSLKGMQSFSADHSIEANNEFDMLPGFRFKFKTNDIKIAVRLNLLNLDELLNYKLNTSWSSNSLNMQRAWDISQGEVDVAVIDTYFNMDNPYIKNNIVESKIFADKKPPYDSHGEHVTDALLEIAPKARIHALGVQSSNGNGLFSKYIIDALEYVRLKKIPIVTMSWSILLANDKAYIDKIDQLASEGIIINWFWYPKENDNVIVQNATWSDTKDEMLINVLDRYNTSVYDMKQEGSWGVSFTSPTTAGIVAVLKSYDNTLTGKDIQELIKRNRVVLEDGKAHTVDVYKMLMDIKNNKLK